MYPSIKFTVFLQSLSNHYSEGLDARERVVWFCRALLVEVSRFAKAPFLYVNGPLGYVELKYGLNS